MFTKTRETTRGSGATYPSEQPHNGDGKLLLSSCYSVVYKAPRACSLKSPSVTVLRWYISVKRDWNDRNDVTKGSWDARVTMCVGFCSENNLYCFRTYFWPEVFMNISEHLRALRLLELFGCHLYTDPAPASCWRFIGRSLLQAKD